MKKINVLQVIYQLGDGGVETMLMDIYRNINHKKYRFVFLVQEPSIKFVDEINSFGGKVINIVPMKEQGIISYIKKLKKIIQEENINVVHAHNLTQNFIVLYAAFVSNVKVRVSHSHLTSSFTLKAKIMMPFIRLLTNLLSTDKLACGKEAGKFLYGRKPFLIINNAIDIDKFVTASRKDLKKEIKDIDKKYIILHVGRLCEQKNHTFIIECAKKLKNEGIKFVILCCGTGPKEEEIKKIIKVNSLENYIYLLGSRSDIPSLMKTADLFILPSLYEGLPVTSIESQASGLKCLFSDTIDKTCDLQLGLVDFLSINDSIGVWTDRIKYYMNDSYDRPKDNQIIDSLIKNGYDAKCNTQKLEEIYERNN